MILIKQEAIEKVYGPQSIKERSPLKSETFFKGAFDMQTDPFINKEQLKNPFDLKGIAAMRQQLSAGPKTFILKRSKDEMNPFTPLPDWDRHGTEKEGVRSTLSGL